MDKNLSTPLAIIIVGVLIGGVLLFGGKSEPANPTAEYGASLRKVDLEIKNMFCIGCRSNVVNSVLSLPGVTQADADPRTDTGWVIYDADVTSKEQIVAASVFQAYPARILWDNSVENSVITNQATIAELSQEIEDKLNQLAQLLEIRQVSIHQSSQDELDQAILNGDYDKANNLLDNLILAYSN